MTRPNGSTWQPDLFNGRGIERHDTSTRTDELAAARQEMRDTGSNDLFDALRGIHMTAKQIERMPYGSPNQINTAAQWLRRFQVFTDTHPILAELVWHRLFTNDVWYMARRNLNAGYLIGEQ